MKIKKSQPILCLKPTQFSIGVLEVEHKVVQAARMKGRRLEKLIRKTPIPIIVAPWGDLYVIDRHHFIFMCWHLKVRRLNVTIVKDFSRTKLSYREFWRRMEKEGWAYLYDQFGTGPREPLYLPPDIRGLADDPYRSLAWMVRKEGAYENSDEPFAEFQWANFFRKKRLLSRHGRRGFIPAVKGGCELAVTRAARGLPGYIGGEAPSAKKQRAAASRFIPEPQTSGELATIPITA